VKLALAAAALIGGLAATPAVAGDRGDKDDKEGRKSPPTPYVVGTWKFTTTSTDGTLKPVTDTEFRFINPTSKALILEYAFFNMDGSFCGCDRDDFPPNKTTVYTMFQELNLGSAQPGGPLVFSCSDSNGALKSIVFEADGQKIKLDDASQIGFQTHVFGVDPDSDPSTASGGNLQGSFLASPVKGAFMTESAMVPVPLDDATREEIKLIHGHCVDVNGPL
jgi:hypothetical protein